MSSPADPQVPSTPNGGPKAGAVHRVHLERAPTAGRAGSRAAVALARQLDLRKREAQKLLGAAPRMLPREFTPQEAEALRRALSDVQIVTRILVGLRSTTRCEAHPQFFDENVCRDCGARLCAVCLLTYQTRRCGRCERVFRRRLRFKRVRVAILLSVAVAVGAWALGLQRRRDERVRWDRPLEVSVVLVSTGPPPADAAPRLREGLAALEARMALEKGRYLSGPKPFHFEGYGPIPLDQSPPTPPTNGTAWQRVVYAWDERRYLAELRERVGAPARSDIILVVDLQGTTASVEGEGEANGEFGLVHIPAHDVGSALSLTAMAHEALHCVGARDHYDEGGHALVPDGLAEPELVPRYPQRFAEVMVGEVPLAPGRGRVPATLGELRVGVLTATEVRWRVSK